MKSPERSLGSNHVDLGGINCPKSDIWINSSIDVGTKANAILQSVCTRDCRASNPFNQFENLQ
jgi:hypothetical protein